MYVTSINYRVLEAFLFKVPEIIGPWRGGHQLESAWLIVLQVSFTAPK